jgi:hypothetical protein
MLFVALERANALMVYDAQSPQPVFLQILKTGVAPEGVLPLPKRNLVAIANEADPGEGLPSTISLFTLIQ